MEAMSLAEKDMGVAGACLRTGEMNVGVAAGAAGPGSKEDGIRDNHIERRAHKVMIDTSSLITVGVPGRGVAGDWIGPLRRALYWIGGRSTPWLDVA
jgi:hypothetical protein